MVAPSQPDGAQRLVVGTEEGKLLLLNNQALDSEFTVSLPAVPAFLASSGTRAVQYTIHVACRDGNVYQVQDDKLAPMVISVPALVIGMVGWGLAGAAVGRVVHVARLLVRCLEG